MSTESDFRPAATIETLRLRSQLLSRVRSFFEQRGFLEVETPILSADVVIDRHLDPFATTLAHDPRQPDSGPRLWLQTSPEFHMKRLLAAGSGSIYQVARVFRNGESGARHNPEFTMVEWYEVPADYQSGMRLLSELCVELLGRAPATLLTYGAAFQQFAGLDPYRASNTQLKEAAIRAGLAPPDSLASDDRDGWLDFLLVELIEPHLGFDQPVILCDYPASQAALARTRTLGDGVQVAERFELYVDGIELANGYHELLDAHVLRERNESNNELRMRDGKPALPSHSRLLAAMQAGLPASTGVALGFDRVVMLAAGKSTISDVMAFPIARA